MVDGVSMLPTLTVDPTIAARKYLCFYYHKNSLEAITDGRYKLVFPHKYVSYDGKCRGTTDCPENWAKVK